MTVVGLLLDIQLVVGAQLNSLFAIKINIRAQFHSLDISHRVFQLALMPVNEKFYRANTIL